MKLADLHDALNARIGSLLLGRGFGAIAEGDFRKPDGTGGFDRVAYDTDGRKFRFWLMLSYYPSYLAVLEYLSPQGEELGFPCGPYLSPAGVFPRGGGWSFRDNATLEASLAQAEQGLVSIGFPWLLRLRDPAIMAQTIDRRALLPSALACEAAGDLAQARSSLQELMSRFLAIIRDNGSDKLVLRDMGKQFVYVAEKLGVETERVARFRAQLDFQLPVARLGDKLPASTT